MFKKLLLTVTATISLFAVSQTVDAATIEDAGLSKERVAQMDKKADDIVKNYVSKNATKISPRTPGVVQNVEDGLYQIRFKDAPFYFSLYGGVSKNGNTIYSWTHSYGATFMFYIKNVGNGEVMIFDTLNFRALEIQNSNTFNGARLQLWDANPYYPTMRWTIQESPINHTAEVPSVNIVNVNSNTAIDVYGSRQVRGNTFHTWQKFNIPSQKYILEKIVVP